MPEFNVLVSSNERREVQRAIGEACLPTVLPFDFLIYTEAGPVARERKEFPGDFLASVEDGRLIREIACMKQVSEFPGVILEGHPRWTGDGHLMLGGRRISRWTRDGLRNLLRSIKYTENCDVEWSDDIEDTAQVLRELHKWFNTVDHVSLHRRRKCEGIWGKPTYEETLIHFYQGLPRISVKRATSLARRFPDPEALLAAQKEELKGDGMAEKLASGIYDFLHKERRTE